MTENNIAVKVEHVSKFFKLPTESTQSLRTTMVNRFRGIKGYKEQHVLKDISFEVKKGDFFGILGRNGSGKSTLLKIISQIYYPEKGSVTVDGKLVSFIELGVGFNPELTGRENVYLNGALLGFSREEIDAMYDDIVDFAELRDFMHQKLKNYSSGMQVRLAFSVAIKAQGDILVLDEVLAVGDEAFQRKCNDYFLERKKSGKTTILVTHDMSAVKKYCNKAVLIENGLVKALGNPDDVANQYSLDNATTTINKVSDSKQTAKEEIPEETEKRPFIDNLKVELLSSSQLTPSDRIRFRVTYEVLEEIRTYVAFSLSEIDKHIWIYNDNSLDCLTSGVGKKSIEYSCSLESVNNVTVKLQVAVRNSKHEVVAFATSEETPILMVARNDISDVMQSERIASSGLIRRNGDWVIVDE